MKSLIKAQIDKYRKKNPDDFETFQEKIQCARVNFLIGGRKRGISLRKAAEKIGITFQHLSYLENGNRKIPGSIILYKIEKVYGFQQGELAKLLAEESKTAI